jgi:hypothetical protein
MVSERQVSQTYPRTEQAEAIENIRQEMSFDMMVGDQQTVTSPTRMSSDELQARISDT